MAEDKNAAKRKRIKAFLRDTVGKHEGGYQNDDKDTGNFVKQGDSKINVGTNHGISAPVLKEYLGRDITADDMKKLSKDEADEILYNNYYKKQKIDKLPEKLQKPVLDFTINSGPRAIKYLQKKAGVKADGQIGPNTVKAFENMGVNDVVDTRTNIIKNSSKIDDKFKEGLIKRSESFREDNYRVPANIKEETMSKQKEYPRQHKGAFFSSDPTKTINEINRRKIADTPRLDLTRPEEGNEIMGEVDRSIEGTRASQEVPSQDSYKPFPSEMLGQEDLEAIAKRNRGEQIVKEKPTVVKELIKQEGAKQGVDPKDIDGAIKNVDNITAGREGASGNSISSQFTNALTFFLPSIIGGLAGAAFEGTDGAIAGAETAQGLHKQYLDEMYRREELDLKKQKQSQGSGKIDITPDFENKETGLPVFTKEVNGVPKFVDDKGNIVPSQSVQSIKDRMSREREGRLEAQSKRNFTQKQVEAGNDTANKFRAYYKDDIEQVKNLEGALDLVDKGLLSSDQLATINAKAIFMEARITDEDVARARISQDLLDRIQSAPERFLTGKVASSEAKQARQLFKAIIERKQKSLKKSASLTATKLRAKEAGMSKKDLEEELLLSARIDPSSKKESEGSVSIETQLEIIKRIKENRNK